MKFVVVDDALVEELWQGVVAKWDDDDVHRAFVEHCRATGRLAQAAARYRVIADSGEPPYRDAGRADEAKKRLGLIVALAMAELDANRTDVDEARRRLQRTTRLVALLLVLLVLLTVWRFAVRHHG